MKGDQIISFEECLQKIREREDLPKDFRQRIVDKLLELKGKIERDIFEELQKQRKEGTGIEDSRIINRAVISVLKREGYVITSIEKKDIRESIKQGVEWIKKQEYQVGGWGWHQPFPDAPIIRKPTAWDTSIVIITLSEVMEKNLDAIQRSVEWLKRNRNPESVWNGSWTHRSNVFDTSFAIIALCKAGEDLSSDVIQDAIRWLEKVWHPFGGWIPTPGEGEIDVGATSWAIVALLEAGEQRDSEIIDKSVNWLKDNQRWDGGWSIGWKGSSGRCYVGRTYDAMNALLKAGVSTDSEIIQKGVEWLVKAQDLVIDAGGWGWGYKPEKFGEVYVSGRENTAMAIMTLLDSGLDPEHWAIQRGIRWLVGMWYEWGRTTPRIILSLHRYIKAVNAKKG